MLKFSRSIWCGVGKKRGEIIEYEGKKYKVLSCSMKIEPPVIGNYSYYLTVSEV